jgi:hypothetical protein
MDWSTFFQALLANDTPLMPGATLQRFAMSATWAIVLVWGVLALGRNWANGWRIALATCIALLTLIPGPTSPAWWLGLAFQMPSLMTTLICLVWVVGGTGHTPAPDPPPRPGPHGFALVGISLGWVLLLDTFAVWPVSVYQWGFSPAIVVLAMVLGCLPWVISGTASGSHSVTLLTASVVALYVLTRLPSGNAWDALIDPWLWLALQWGWVRNWLGRWRLKRHALGAIRG